MPGRVAVRAVTYRGGVVLTLGVAAACGGSGGGADQARGTAGAMPGAAHAVFAYVSNEGSDNISVIDTRVDSVVATIFVGKRPRGIRVSPDGRTIYVALSGSPRGGPGVDESKLPPPDKRYDGVAAVDVASYRVNAILPGGSDPETFDVDPASRTLYVSNEDSGTASVVDIPARRVIARVPVGREPEGVRLAPDGKTVWVTSEGDATVSVIDTRSNTVRATVSTGKRPRNVAFTPDGAVAYVTAEVGGVVTVVDARTFRVRHDIRLPPGSKPMGVVVSPDGRRVYVTTGRGGMLAVVATGSDSLLAAIPVGARPWGVAVTPDGRKVYTANGPSGDVSVLDAATLKVVKRVKVGKLPGGVAMSSGERAPHRGAPGE